LVYPLGVCGAVYTGVAVMLGIPFVKKARQLLGDPENREIARSLFKYSILYMMLLCVGMVADSLPWAHSINYAVAENLQTFLCALSVSF